MKNMIFIFTLLMAIYSQHSSKFLDFDIEADKIDLFDWQSKDSKYSKQSTIIEIINQKLDFDSEVDKHEKILADNSCFDFYPVNNKKFTTSFSTWSGIFVEFTLMNKCSTSKPINNLQLFISGYSINNDSNLFYTSQILSTPWLLSSELLHDNT